MKTLTKTSIKRIGIQEALERAHEEITFVDARSAASIARNPWRISGAINITSKNVDEGIRQLSPKRTIVTYCS